MNPLTTEAGRKEAAENLHLELFAKLKSLNLGFHPELRGRIDETVIGLGIIDAVNPDRIHTTMWGSEIQVYPAIERFGKVRFPEINFGASGSFSPENTGPFWRTIHAAIILQNWEVLMPIFKDFCERYTILMNEIQNANQ